MKKLLADFLGIEEVRVIKYKFNYANHDLNIETKWDCPVITGTISEPQYKVEIAGEKITKNVNLEELLVFIYNKACS